jgi:hypothetical protein
VTAIIYVQYRTIFCTRIFNPLLICPVFCSVCLTKEKSINAKTHTKLVRDVLRYCYDYDTRVRTPLAPDLPRCRAKLASPFVNLKLRDFIWPTVPRCNHPGESCVNLSYVVKQCTSFTFLYLINKNHTLKYGLRHE